MNLNLESVIFNNTVWQWIVSFVIICSTLIGLILLDKLVIYRLKKIDSKLSTKPSNIFIEPLKKTKWWFYVVVSMWFGLISVELPEESLIVKVILILIMLQAGIWGNQLISSIIASYGKTKVDNKLLTQSALNLFSIFVKMTFWILILLLILANLGYEITPLVASLGIGGLAIAFAVQNILVDIFASFSIVIDKPFVIGDSILVDQYRGTVEHIGIKTTRIRSLSGEEIIFSNNDLLKSRIRNYKRMTKRRVLFNFQVSFKTEHEKLNKIPDTIEKVINSIEMTRFDRAHLKEIGEYALVYEIVYYITDPKYTTYMDIQQEINYRILKYLQEQNIQFAHPIRIIKDSSE